MIVKEHYENMSFEYVPRGLAWNLGGLATIEEKESILKNRHPDVYISYLKSVGRTEDVKKLFDGRMISTNMIWYVYVELLPYLARKRKDKTLKYVVDSSDAYDWPEEYECSYTGEVNEEGKATGFGEAKTGSRFVRGTFLNGKAEGIVTIWDWQFKHSIGTQHKGKWHGYKTDFRGDPRKTTEIYNFIVDKNAPEKRRFNETGRF